MQDAALRDAAAQASGAGGGGAFLPCRSVPAPELLDTRGGAGSPCSQTLPHWPVMASEEALAHFLPALTLGPFTTVLTNTHAVLWGPGVPDV